MEKDGDSFVDWDWDPVAEEELRAIEGVYYSSANKRRISSDLDADDPAPLHSRPSGRRLPDWGRTDFTESQCHGGHGGGVARAIADRLSSSCPTNGAWRVSPLRCPGWFRSIKFIFSSITKEAFGVSLKSRFFLGYRDFVFFFFFPFPFGFYGNFIMLLAYPFCSFGLINGESAQFRSLYFAKRWILSPWKVHYCVYISY